MREALARAHANIALVKYWGKRDEERILPMNGSISMTVDPFYVTTAVTFEDGLPEDRLVLNGLDAAAVDQRRVTTFLDRIRALARVDARAVIRSENHVPTGAGLASSSAAYAALAMAATRALGLNLSPTDLSKLARQGSGSASRSVYGGFVEWLKGNREDGEDSYAVPLAPPDYWDIRMVMAIVDSGPKSVSSRDGMRSVVETSPFYAGWQATVESDLAAVRNAILRRDFAVLGQVAEANAFKMHATTMGAVPPFTYWSGTTIEVIRRVQQMRGEGVPAYVTIDAGPHVVVLCEPQHASWVEASLAVVPGVKEVVQAGPGPDAREVDAW